MRNRQFFFFHCAVFLFLMFGPVSYGTLHAEEDESEPAATVVDFYRDDPMKERKAGLGDRLVVKVQGLRRLLDQAAKSNKDIVLYLGGMALKGVRPDFINTQAETLTFQLERNEENALSWSLLLGRPKKFTRKLDLSVGLVDEYPLSSNAKEKFELIIIRKWGFWLCLAIFIGTVLVLFMLARTTGMLRYPGPKLAGNAARPYSLARTQMAFWFVLAITSFVLIWCITGVLSGLTESVLALIGIGSGTALGAALVDASKASKAKAERQMLRKDLHGRKRKIDALSAKIIDTGEQAAKQVLQNELVDLKNAQKAIEAKIRRRDSDIVGMPSQGFFSDILNDANGISFHRFQIFVWTMVLGIIFVVSVYQKLEMPDFSGTLLALMGISSGTYIGFKFPERFEAEQGSESDHENQDT